jgi:site-specific DNA-methyltransferase (adenine-specific)
VISIAQNRDCMEAMAEFEDGFFDLAVVDPPYGIGAERNGMGQKKGRKPLHSRQKRWDNEKPDSDYFLEIFRLSKNQIIWGGNYFDLPKTGAWVFWDKMRSGWDAFSDGELAWTSFKTPLRAARIKWQGAIGQPDDYEKIHPTQKPVALYSWIFKNYAKPGMKILDTHLGSGSSRIAADKFWLDFWGYELDKEYFEAQEKRWADYKAQSTLF